MRLGDLWYDSWYCIAFGVTTFACSFRVRGRHHMPKTGPVLVISNHQSFLDPIINGIASPRRMAYLGRESLFRNPLMNRWLRSFGGIPIDHRGFSREGLQATLKCLEEGKVVIVYPEGERTHDGQMQPFKPGISLLIKRMKAPIVPMGIAGAFHTLSRFQKIPRLSPLFLEPNPAALAVSIGPPLDPTIYAEMERDEMITKLHDAVATEFAKAQQLQRKRCSLLE